MLGVQNLDNLTSWNLVSG